MGPSRAPAIVPNGSQNTSQASTGASPRKLDPAQKNARRLRVRLSTFLLYQLELQVRGSNPLQRDPSHCSVNTPHESGNSTSPEENTSGFQRFSGPRPPSPARKRRRGFQQPKAHGRVRVHALDRGDGSFPRAGRNPKTGGRFTRHQAPSARGKKGAKTRQNHGNGESPRLPGKAQKFCLAAGPELSIVQATSFGQTIKLTSEITTWWKHWESRWTCRYQDHSPQPMATRKPQVSPPAR